MEIWGHKLSHRKSFSLKFRELTVGTTVIWMAYYTYYMSIMLCPEGSAVSPQYTMTGGGRHARRWWRYNINDWGDTLNGDVNTRLRTRMLCHIAWLSSFEEEVCRRRTTNNNNNIIVNEMVAWIESCKQNCSFKINFICRRRRLLSLLHTKHDLPTGLGSR